MRQHRNGSRGANIRRGAAFDQLLIDTVRAAYPPHEHDQLIAHLRGLAGLWVADENTRLHGT